MSDSIFDEFHQPRDQGLLTHGLAYYPGGTIEELMFSWQVGTPLLLAPKLFWPPDNALCSSTYANRSDEVASLNEWVKTLNVKNDTHQVPAFSIMGTRATN